MQLDKELQEGKIESSQISDQLERELKEQRKEIRSATQVQTNKNLRKIFINTKKNLEKKR